LLKINSVFLRGLKHPLKIFIIGPAYPLRGGPAQFNENLCAELIKQGHDAQIVSYSLQYPNFLFPGSSQYEKGASAPMGIPIHTRINTVNPLNWWQTANFIKHQKPDFVLFRYWLPFFGPSLGTIARLIRKHTKVLALTDNVMPHEKRPGDTAFTKYFIKSCDGFIAMSKTVLRDIEKFNRRKPKAYAPHPMYETYGSTLTQSEARKKLGLKDADKIVLFFGLIRHYKGLDLLMEAMLQPDIQALGIKLLVAGEFYEDKSNYQHLLDKLQASGQLILHDRFIANENVREYFCACNLVAQTYRHATNSGVTMVGYYYGKPMLVTNVGGLAEIVPNQKCGYVVDTTTTAVAEKIQEYFQHNHEATFSAAVQEERKKYEWPEFINTLLMLYNNCL
jgi:glycosyltransferase involved in cell wall biosynthesis